MDSDLLLPGFPTIKNGQLVQNTNNHDENVLEQGLVMCEYAAIEGVPVHARKHALLLFDERFQEHTAAASDVHPVALKQGVHFLSVQFTDKLSPFFSQDET